MANIDNIKKYKKIHMIGIGGVSMSGIAEILKNWGFNITGSDSSNSDIIEKLKNNGIPVSTSHNLDNVAGADLVIYSAAIKQDNIELQEAKRLGIPIVERSVFLGEITKAYEDTICVSGTHGKTTTTSMLSCCFLEADLDPSIQVGAILKEIDGNYRIGNSEYFILEACEYVESFLKFTPTSEIILNIDNDHLDYFKTFDNIKNAFIKYVKLLPSNGLLILNADDKNCLDLKSYTNCKLVTYGIENNSADFTAKNIIFNKDGFASFDVYYRNEFYSNIQLSIAGNHNISNALACISLCHSYKLPTKAIKSGLLKFTGANRRLEYKGSFNQIKIYDDYGHHPTEIKATAKAIKNKQFKESWVIFQPHTYSRTYNLLNDFAESLLDFDHIILTDIYAAREKNTYNISSENLAEKIESLGKDVTYLSSFEEIVRFVKLNSKPQDIIITLGAGTITQIGPMFLE